MSKGIRDNQVKPVNKIHQDEHEDNLDAKRVVNVGSDGEVIGSDITINSGGNQVTGEVCEVSGIAGLHTIDIKEGFQEMWDDIEVTVERPDGQPEELITRKNGIDKERALIEYSTAGNFRRMRVFKL